MTCTHEGLHHQALDIALASGDHHRAHEVLDAYAHDHSIAVAAQACLAALVSEIDTYIHTVDPDRRTPALRQLIGSLPLRHARHLKETR